MKVLQMAMELLMPQATQQFILIGLQAIGVD
jgi:hypothetical protein